MAGRPKKIPVFPDGLHQGQAVKVRCSEYNEPKLGIITDWCRYKDGGINVRLTKESDPGFSGFAVYVCIQTERGDTIEGIEIDKQRVS